MFLRRLFYLGFFTVLFLNAPSSAYCAESQATVEIGAVILDPLQIDLESAKKLCDDSPEMVKCDILKERLEEKDEEALISLEPREYTVYTANFE